MSTSLGFHFSGGFDSFPGFAGMNPSQMMQMAQMMGMMNVMQQMMEHYFGKDQGCKKDHDHKHDHKHDHGHHLAHGHSDKNGSFFHSSFSDGHGNSSSTTVSSYETPDAYVTNISHSWTSVG